MSTDELFSVFVGFIHIYTFSASLAMILWINLEHKTNLLRSAILGSEALRARADLLEQSSLARIDNRAQQLTSVFTLFRLTVFNHSLDI